MRKGWFITVEGGEGAGKTTVLEKIETELHARNLEVVRTREPGGIPIAEKIRSLILDVTHTNMDSRTEALLYAAARRQHFVEKIMPALQAGKAVLCDRFIDSSLAYQGIAREIGYDAILDLNEFAIEGCYPDLTLFFDVDPEIGLARISQDRAREVNRLDQESLQFHHKVRDGYLNITKQFPERVVVIDANQSFDHVLEQTMGTIHRNWPVHMK